MVLTKIIDTKTGEYINCLVCRRSFYVQAFLIKSGRRKFCSSACHNIYQTKPLSETKCIRCGVVFKFKTSRLKVGPVKYCSWECTKVEKVSRECTVCGKKFVNRDNHNIGQKHCSHKCATEELWLNGNISEKSLAKTDTHLSKLISRKEYKSIHGWLKYRYGKAKSCANPECSKENNVFQWAKIRGLNYERLRSNFVNLCQKCHTLYDLSKIDIKLEQNLF